MVATRTQGERVRDCEEWLQGKAVKRTKMKILKLHSVSSSGPCSGPCCPAAYSRSLVGVHTACVVASG